MLWLVWSFDWVAATVLLPRCLPKQAQAMSRPQFKQAAQRKNTQGRIGAGEEEHEERQSLHHHRHHHHRHHDNHHPTTMILTIPKSHSACRLEGYTYYPHERQTACSSDLLQWSTQSSKHR